MDNQVLKSFGIFLIIIFLIYLLIYGLNYNIIEGLTNNNNEDNNIVKINKGETINASSFAENIKSKVIQLQDELLISKYRKDYENIIINLDEYINYLMLRSVLNVNIDGVIKNDLIDLNTLKTAKSSLNETMKILDNI
jgi:hypothetical protein